MSWRLTKSVLTIVLVSLSVPMLVSSSGGGKHAAAADGCSIMGTAGRDVIRGTPERDVICPLGGDDLVYGLGGGDRILGGAGNDRIFGGAGDDEIFAGGGNDRADGGPGDDRILTGLGHDSLLGGPGNDLLYARDGARDNADGNGGLNLIVADRADQVRRARRVAALPKSGPANEKLHIVAAAADIACDPGDGDFAGGRGDTDKCRQHDTSALVLAMRPNAVLIPGDHQYPDGAHAKFLGSFHPSWGRLKHLIRPVPGNHEYDDPAGGASGYFRYYGAAAGDPARGYYSFDLGAWHVLALNSECRHVGGCGVNSPQDKWLQLDLAASGSGCTLAFFHRPRFSSGQHGNDAGMGTFWRRLYDAGAEVILNGHDHDYERLAPLDPDGKRDEKGIRQFIVGMGGKDLRGFQTIHPASEARNATTFGVLKLILRATSYSWEFVPVGGVGSTDTGTGTCR